MHTVRRSNNEWYERFCFYQTALIKVDFLVVTKRTHASDGNESENGTSADKQTERETKDSRTTQTFVHVYIHTINSFLYMVEESENY